MKTETASNTNSLKREICNECCQVLPEELECASPDDASTYPDSDSRYWNVSGATSALVRTDAPTIRDWKGSRLRRVVHHRRDRLWKSCGLRECLLAPRECGEEECDEDEWEWSEAPPATAGEALNERLSKLVTVGTGALIGYILAEKDNADNTTKGLYTLAGAGVGWLAERVLNPCLEMLED